MSGKFRNKKKIIPICIATSSLLIHVCNVFLSSYIGGNFISFAIYLINIILQKSTYPKKNGEEKLPDR
jgi:hypothetical protein